MRLARVARLHAREQCDTKRAMSASTTGHVPHSPSRAFFAGFRSAWNSVFALVLAGTYVGIGAIAHDLGFSSWWLALSSLLVWAAPAQLILITALGTGAALFEAAIAVTLSAIRLMPMVVALLPIIRPADGRLKPLLLPTHFTSVSMWVESLRLLPALPREERIPFCNGLSIGYMSVAVIFGFVGFYLVAGLPPIFAAALLFLTPISFLITTARNCRMLFEYVAMIAGLIIGPLLAWYQVNLDLMWTGVIGGAIGYAVYKVRRFAT